MVGCRRVGRTGLEFIEQAHGDAIVDVYTIGRPIKYVICRRTRSFSRPVNLDMDVGDDLSHAGTGKSAT